jgi:hypothetical protein
MKSIQNTSFLNKNIVDIYGIISKTGLEELKEYKNIDINEKNIQKEIEQRPENYLKDIEDEFKKIITSDVSYELINSYFLKQLFVPNNEGFASVDINICIGGLLDEYFHTIISPNKYGKNNFAKIFNYYWFCYFSIVEPIVKYYKKDRSELKEYLNDEKLNYYKIISNIKDFTNILYSNRAAHQKNYNNNLIKNDESYYSIIKDRLNCNDRFIIRDIATTNYFNFCEILKREPIYLNGALNLFEIPEKLEVVDAKRFKGELNQNYLFFPFLFVQSLIKPIVNKAQIESIFKFGNALERTDVLIVFGYNMNEDDNHINAFLHTFATSMKIKKRLIIIGEEEEKVGRKKCSEKLKCDVDEIEYCSVKYGNNYKVIDKMIEKLESQYK